MKWKGIVVLFTVLLLTACASKSHPFAPGESSIYLRRDAGIQSAVVSVLPSGEYTAEGLLAFAKGEADRYNAENGGEKVTVSEAVIEGNTAKVIYSYDSDTSLIDFAVESQDTSFELSSLMLLSVEEALTSPAVEGFPEEFAKRKKLHVALIEGSGSFITEGKILYVDTDVEYADNHVRLPQGSHMIIFD